MLQKPTTFDVCLICALPEEAVAAEEAIRRRCQASFQQGFSQRNKYEYHFTSISNKNQEQLTLLLSWLPSKGLMETGMYIQAFLQEFQPRFVAMTGICAGDKSKARLGDLIVAEYAYIYDSGKVVADEQEQGQKKHFSERQIYHPNQQTLQYARCFQNWKEDLKRFVPPPDGLMPPQCHIVPLASGNAVRSDSPFQDLPLITYKTAAIDMEGAAFYRAVSDFPKIKCLLVKGICDYADADKDDAYHTYAALISATYLLCFICEYVTEETMPTKASISAQQANPFIRSVPFLRNPLFTGREEVLLLLRDRLTSAISSGFSPVQALCGLGGIGKTQIATEYTYLYSEYYQQIFWVNADTEHTLIADFVSIARQLDLLTGAEEDYALLIKRVKHWLSTHDQWLLILDNMGLINMVYDFLPGQYKGHIIFTTQAQTSGPFVQCIELRELSPEKARSLLLRRAKMSISVNVPEYLMVEEETAARTIIARLGCFPLALDQAGAYIEETSCSLSDYLTQLSQRELELLQRRGSTSWEHPISLATTWSLAFEKVEQANPLAANLLRFCAFLAPDTIPQEVIVADRNLFTDHLDSHQPTCSSRFDEAIALLRRFSLVRRNPYEKTLSLHRLVQVVVKAQMDDMSQHIWSERVVRAVNAAFPSPGEASWSEGNRYLPQVFLCMTYLHDDTPALSEAATLFSRAGRWLHEHAQYKEAERLYLRVRDLQGQQGDTGRLSLAKILDSLTRLNLDIGMHRQASAFGHHALRLKKEIFGAEHPEVARTLYLLGRLSHAQIEYAQAQVFYREALLLNERAFGLESPETATTLHALAWLCQDQKFYTRAEHLYQQVLSIRLQKLGKNHISTAITLHQLAWLSQQRQRYLEAEGLYRQALAMKELAVGPNHPSTAITLHYFARCFHDQKRYKQAEELYQRALAIREQTLGLDHPFTAETLLYRARLFHDQKRYKQAEELYQRALAIHEQVYGPEHFMTAITLHHFARLWATLRQNTRADHFYQRVLTIRRRLPGNNHFSTITVAQEYAHFLHTLQ